MRYLGLAQLKEEGTLTSFDAAYPLRIRKKDVPRRPRGAEQVLLGDKRFRVFDAGLFRWRYVGSRLVRFVEYHPKGATSTAPFAREWQSRRMVWPQS
jgi:hypothetical protein